MGIDVGGSHISAALVDMETCAILPGSYVRREINTQRSVDEIINDWGEVIEASTKVFDNVSGKIGIAMPGPFDYDNGISMIRDQNKYEVLYQLNVRELLAVRLGMSAGGIKFLNDAECFLLGELLCGAAQGCTQVLGLTLGTGLGSAGCRNGQAEDAALWSSPFKEGIAEDYLSTRWFEKRYFALTGLQVNGVKELAALAQENAVVRLIFEEFGRNLAKFITGCARVYNPSVVVLGGNIAKAYVLFAAELKAALEQEAMHITVQEAALGEEAALIGAASAWKAQVLASAPK